MTEIVLQWIQAHGYPVLAVLLGVGVVGIPLPDETLLVSAGLLAREGTLRLFPTLLTAVLGSYGGITSSYVIGRLAGRRVLACLARRSAARRRHLRRARRWYNRNAGLALMFGYFVPGVRHFTAIFAGSVALRLPVFMLFAYVGATLWATSFVLIGYYGGERWLALTARIHHGILIALGIIFLLTAVYLIFRSRGRLGITRS